MPQQADNTFVFCTCQPGGEQPLKRELASRRPQWRLAYSRPGFVSFKCEQSVGAALDGSLPVFARTRSISLGQIKCDQLATSAAMVWQNDKVRDFLATQTAVGLHVWQRDSQLPGDGGFEPSITPLAREIRDAILLAANDANLGDQRPSFDTTVAPTGGMVLDVAVVEPDEWYLGWHRATSRPERWPGGMLPVAAPEQCVSRAYLKMEEALKWAAVPTTRSDVWVELGCAPGGASLALLNRGFHVIGVDPGEIDELVASHSRFLHVRKRSADVRRTEFAPAKWLAADLNATPQYTLDAVQDVVAHPATAIRGLVLTLKLTNWDFAAPDKLNDYIQRVKSWGYRDVRLRQLVHSRQELCLVALHSRGQRRMKRKRKQSAKNAPADSNRSETPSEVRFDAPTRMVPPHHFR